MASHRFLLGRDCVQCTSTPTCNCAADQDCILTARTCSSCATIQCIDKEKSSSSSSGVSAGIIAGPVVAVVVLALASFALWWWFRKRKLRDLAKVAEIEKHRTTLMLDSARPLSGRPGSHNSGDPQMESTSERFPRDVRSSFEEEAAAPLGRPVVPRSRPLTGIAEGDERRLSAQQNARQDDPLQRQSHLAHPNNPFDDRQSVATDQISFTSSTNVIPIAFVPSHPPSSSARASNPNPLSAQTALDVARERALKTGRLKVGIAVPPSRPARSPDLDLRLNPQNNNRSVDGNIVETLAVPDQASHNAQRLSVTTTRSAAPSFFSGTSEFAATGMDAPMIMTSRQVQLGIRQAADLVHIPPSAAATTLDPFSDAHTPQLRSQRSTATFGGGARDHHLSHQSSADDGQFAGSDAAGDLRFSMGSLAGSNLRDSISTQGTGALRDVVVGEARKINLGAMSMQPPTAWQTRCATHIVPVPSADSEPPLMRPRPGFAAPSEAQSSEQYGARESMMSGRSDDSFLNAIIPPKPSFSESPAKGPYTASNLAQKLPTSMSTETFHSGALFTGASPGKPPPSLPQQTAQSPQRSTGFGQNPLASESRHTLGLSGFEFQIGDHDEAEMEELPALPAQTSTK
ncbi:hypothetical protein NliqN6_3172 [Naganishia liquefaciens]|uniref:Membrane anchor Opy2 N-terminal domain-containing protein n=1 Tax=Naganishia liquefaciens TaxID=104408 RepID=A0A8H3YEN5_9TREE|nr:hypothetical protein NliqN6_3172 [Naganishia liquefaciens]